MKWQIAIEVLCEAEVEFVVIGGVSANIHGSAFVTFDLDICYAHTRENLRRLAKALEPYHPRPTGFDEALPFLWDETTIHNAALLTLQTDLGRIDLISEVKGVGNYEEVKAHSVIVHAHDVRFAILDLPSLVKAKRAAGRAKDLHVVPELEGLLEAEEPQEPT